MEQCSLAVSAMESGECERAVTSALINVPGVYWATADRQTQSVCISYDPEEVNLDELCDAISVSGYPQKTA